MNRPPATARPTRLARRLVVAIAFLVGSAFALAIRIPAAQAQDAATAPAAAPSPASSKTLTITDGAGSVGAKIEFTETPATAPRAAPEPGAASPAPVDKAGRAAASGDGVTPGKGGRIRIEGVGSDPEFDSFSEFVHEQPAIAFMVVAIVAVVFLSPVLAIGLILGYRYRKNRMLNETMLKLAEKGVVPPAEALQALASGGQAAALTAGAATGPLYEQAKQIRRRAVWSDLRKGVIIGAIGLALTLDSLFEDGTSNALGLVLLLVGIGFVVVWWFEQRQLTQGNGVAPDSRGPPGASPSP